MKQLDIEDITTEGRVISFRGENYPQAGELSPSKLLKVLNEIITGDSFSGPECRCVCHIRHGSRNCDDNCCAKCRCCDDPRCFFAPKEKEPSSWEGRVFNLITNAQGSVNEKEFEETRESLMSFISQEIQAAEERGRITGRKEVHEEAVESARTVKHPSPQRSKGLIEQFTEIHGRPPRRKEVIGLW